MERKQFIAANISELEAVGADDMDTFTRLLRKVVVSYGSGQTEFAFAVASWNGENVLETGSDGGAGQSGDGWVIGRWDLVQTSSLIDDPKLEEFDELTEEELDKSIEALHLDESLTRLAESEAIWGGE